MVTTHPHNRDIIRLVECATYDEDCALKDSNATPLCLAAQHGNMVGIIIVVTKYDVIMSPKMLNGLLQNVI